MNRKGFTLVELLVTIALIAILGIISSSVIVSSLNGSKNNIDDKQKEILLSTAKMYLEENLDTFSYDPGNQINVCIQQDLVKNNYLNESEISSEGIIKIVPTIKNGRIVSVDGTVSIEAETDCYEEE